MTRQIRAAADDGEEPAVARESDVRQAVALTFFGPGCWLWQTGDPDGDGYGEGVAGSRERAVEDARAHLEASDVG